MAGYGPPPAENRRRRNADRYEGHEVTVDQAATVEAPPLPGRHPKAVQDWYATWCSSPQAQAFTVTDWQRLHMLAPLVAAYFKRPDKQLMSEIRLNESLLGATHVDRLRARIKVAETPPGEPTTSAAEDEVAKKRRQRILDAS